MCGGYFLIDILPSRSINIDKEKGVYSVIIFSYRNFIHTKSDIHNGELTDEFGQKEDRQNSKKLKVHILSSVNFTLKKK